MWSACARRDRHPSGGRAAALRPSGRRWHQKQRQSRLGRGAGHVAAASATDGGHSSPRSLREGGSLPTRRQAPTQRTLLLSTDDECP
jgi:hypothetical protein